MSELSRRPSGRARPPSRREREQRAFALIVATGGLGVVAVLGILLAVIGVIGYAVPVLAAGGAGACGLALRRMLGK